MTKDEINQLGVLLAKLREHTGGDDYVIVSVGARGPNMDTDGNTVATVRSGDDEATAQAKYLIDAINLAKGKIERERKARAEAKAKSRDKQQAEVGA